MFYHWESKKADAVRSRYLHEPQKTAETLIDGWIHTGDKGEIDDDGFLKVTGRVKEIFKTAKGKYVAPLPIESMFISNANLEQACLMGSGQPQTTLLVQLSAHGLAADTDTLTEDLSRQALLVNDDLDSHARVACVIVSEGEWTSANGLVTHTLKIKRSALEQRYFSHSEAAFSAGASPNKPLVIWEGRDDLNASLQLQ
jgi:long-chain acyl-CoA synthetase